jgi:hypothetical protein
VSPKRADSELGAVDSLLHSRRGSEGAATLSKKT